VVLYLDGVAGNPASLPLPKKMTLPFPATSEEFEEYRRVMDEMADEADRLPDPQPEDLTHLGGDFRHDADDGYAGDPFGRDDNYSGE
jgi:hypothetical protein